jgi:hypothetical protein
VAIVLMVSGVALVGAFTACVAAAFLRDNKPSTELEQLIREVKLLRGEISQLRSEAMVPRQETTYKRS